MMNLTRDLDMNSNPNPGLNLSPIRDQDLIPIVKRGARRFQPLERMSTNADDDCDLDLPSS
jgi:hypothetical protein